MFYVVVGELDSALDRRQLSVAVLLEVENLVAWFLYFCFFSGLEETARKNTKIAKIP